MTMLGTLPPAIRQDVVEILSLLDREATLRCSARIHELVPAKRRLAGELIGEADALRSRRLFLLDRCGLSR